MIYGVNIGGKDTLEEWGLMLCDDLTIGAAAPRFRFVTVPEMSGALDLTDALTGRVTYEQRKISFTLFAVHDVIAGTRHPATEAHLRQVLADFYAFANGKRLSVYLPDDTDHYFVGRVSIGEKSGYNSGRVKVEITADPYRYKATPTSVTVSTAGTVTLTNEAMPVTPVFTATHAGATVTLGNVTHTLSAGQNQFSDIVLGYGQNVLTVANLTGTITISYQEGSL